MRSRWEIIKSEKLKITLKRSTEVLETQEIPERSSYKKNSGDKTIKLSE